MDAKFSVKHGIEAKMLEAVDTPALAGAIERNYDRLSKWFSWTTGGFNEDAVAAYVADAEAERQRDTDYAFALYDGDRLVGTAGLYRIDRRNGIARIGYWIDAAYEGRGIVSAVVRELITRAFEGERLNRIEIRCAPANEPSRRIPERLGFTLEGAHREVLAIHGEHQDLIMYAMLKRDWSANNV